MLSEKLLLLTTLDTVRTPIHLPSRYSRMLKHYVSDNAQKQMCRLGWEQDSWMYPTYSELDEAQRHILEAQKAYLGYARARWYNRDFVISSGDLFEKYFADEITLDEMANGLRQKLRMVLWG